MKNLLIVFVLIIASFFIGNFVLAGCICNGNPTSDTKTDCESRDATLNCVWQGADPNATSGTVSLTNPLGGSAASPAGKTSIPELLGSIINSVLGIIGSLALVMFIYGGATWMTSAGNQEQVTKGKNILIWAALGIIIIFSAYALVKFVLTTVTTGG